MPPVDFDRLRERLEKDQGGSVETVFARFDPKPLAAASIAQIYSARLHVGADAVI